MLFFYFIYFYFFILHYLNIRHLAELHQTLKYSIYFKLKKCGVCVCASVNYQLHDNVMK